MDRTPQATPAVSLPATPSPLPASATSPAPTSTLTFTQPPSPTLAPSPSGTDSPVPPAATATLQPVEIPRAAIQILSPGPASKVTSPFLLRAVVVPGPNGVVRTELLGEDGRLLLRDLKVYQETRGVAVNMAIEVEFGISAVAEAARLQISVEDEHDRTAALASVDLVLLSIGRADLNPPGDLLEEILIQSPRPGALVQGGLLTVSGLARPRTDQPLFVEIFAPDGEVLGSRQVAVSGQSGAGHGTFAVDVPYAVTEPTRVLVVVWERGERIPGVAHLSSVEVMVGP